MTTNALDATTMAILRARATGAALHAIGERYPLDRWRTENEAETREVYLILAEDTSANDKIERLLKIVSRLKAR